MITDKKIKPKRKLIVVIGFVLSLIFAIFVVMIAASRKNSNYKNEDAYRLNESPNDNMSPAVNTNTI